MVRIETVLDTWKTVRADAAQAVEEFPPDELDYRPAPDCMSFREAARHILDAGHALTGLLLDGEENMATPDFREKLKKYIMEVSEEGGAAALASAMREAVEIRCAQLAARTPDFFAHVITRFDGTRVTRLEMLQFVKEHELTHRAQMFVYLRLKGLVPPTTRRRQAKK